MELKNLILIIVAAINFIMALVLILKNKRSPINLSFALVMLGGGLWTLGLSMFNSTLNMQEAVAWARIYYFAAAIIIISFLFFSNYYIYKLREFDIVKLIYILIPFLIVTVVIFHPSFLIEKVTNYSWGNDANEKLLGHLIFAIYVISYLIWSYCILFKKLKTSDGINKGNLIYVILGTIFSFIFGIIFDLILPILGNYELIWIGPYFTLFTSIFLIYLIFFRSHK